MTPQLVTQFWTGVKRRLVDDYRLPRPDANKWTREYRARLRSHHVGDAVYNRGEDVAAATIAHAAEVGGFPEPQPV